LEDLCIDGILKSTLKRHEGRMYTELFWLRTGNLCGALVDVVSVTTSPTEF
jgi:hypothetical protein